MVLLMGTGAMGLFASVEEEGTIYCPCTAPDTNLNEALGESLLLIIIVRVCNLEPWMYVDGIYNVPEAHNCLGVTNTIIGHNVIC
jgi:hypothetical protein